MSTRRLRIALVSAVPAALCFVAVRSYLRETRQFFPPRAPVTISVAASGLPAVEVVSFRTSEGASMHGWYAPSKNRAAIVLVHGAGGDRTSLLPEARFLSARGFGVLTFDLPGHGESDGEIHWGDGESRALEAALGFVSTRADVDPSRIGALGFSMGGAVLARVAATRTDVRAVALVSTPGDQEKQAKWVHGAYGAVSSSPAIWSLRRGAPSLFVDRPVDRVASIAPRPLLVVSGTDDFLIPAFLTNELFDRARDPKELVWISGGGHGGFDDRAPDVYRPRVLGFFERALL